eukprot:CAMPEP_0185848292 /NCGR_PEP_ID=MMETSP1354-20130828/3240_1 /TAXON_ID=708628 /ORGANISM="Erythrolobus madagascarensis, Strain CCMP3276" /LENGTH=502 /DNA_ID=CAMNT_0028548679 /DNA_START=254 /DNA_END=1762 /DNA_ORIENTATION=-
MSLHKLLLARRSDGGVNESGGLLGSLTPRRSARNTPRGSAVNTPRGSASHTPRGSGSNTPRGSGLNTPRGSSSASAGGSWFGSGGFRYHKQAAARKSGGGGRGVDAEDGGRWRRGSGGVSAASARFGADGGSAGHGSVVNENGLELERERKAPERKSSRSKKHSVLAKFGVLNAAVELAVDDDENDEGDSVNDGSIHLVDHEVGRRKSISDGARHAPQVGVEHSPKRTLLQQKNAGPSSLYSSYTHLRQHEQQLQQAQQQPAETKQHSSQLDSPPKLEAHTDSHSQAQVETHEQRQSMASSKRASKEEIRIHGASVEPSSRTSAAALRKTNGTFARSKHENDDGLSLVCSEDEDDSDDGTSWLDLSGPESMRQKRDAVRSVSKGASFSAACSGPEQAKVVRIGNAFAKGGSRSPSSTSAEFLVVSSGEGSRVTTSCSSLVSAMRSEKDEGRGSREVHNGGACGEKRGVMFDEKVRVVSYVEDSKQQDELNALYALQSPSNIV